MQVFVDITLHSVKLSLNREIRLNIIWKRKTERIETRSKVMIPAGSELANIGQTLSAEEKVNKLAKRVAEVYLQALTDAGAKVIGRLTLPLFPLPINRLQYRVDHCPDPSAVLLLSISARSPSELPPTADSPIIIKRPLKSALAKKVSLVSRSGKEELRLSTEDEDKGLEGLQEELKTARAKVAAMSEELRRVQDQADARVQDLEYDKGRLNRALERAEKELKEVSQMQLTQSQVSFGVYQHTIADLSKRLQEKEVELLSRNTDSEVLHKTLTELTASIESQKVTSRRYTVSQLENQRAKECAVNTAEKAVEATEGETIEKLQGPEAEIAHIREEQASAIARADTEISELRSDVFELTSALELCQQPPSSPSVDSLSTLIADLKQQLHHSEEALKTQQDKHREDVAVLERHVTALNNARKKVDIEMERLKLENKQLKGGGERTRTDEEKREKELLELELMVKYAQNERFEVEQRYAELKLSSAKDHAAREELTDELRRAKSELRDAKQQLAEIEIQCCKANEHLGQVLNLHNELEAENRSLREQVGTLRKTAQ